MDARDEELNLVESPNDHSSLKIQKEFDVKSLYPSIIVNVPQETKFIDPIINTLQETKFTTRTIIEEIVKKHNELKQNNSFELKKIKVFLPGDLYKKNKEKDFKHLELFLDLPNDPWRDALFKPTSGRSILIVATDEPGYSYKPINFNMYDLSDEELDEFLKIFNLRGSCTSKISLCD